MKKMLTFLMIVFASAVFALNASAVGSIDNSSSGDYVPIVIDGSYNDWADKPHSIIQYAWDDGNNRHQGALFRDEDYIYLHIAMSPKSYTSFNGYNYRFTVDGKEIYVLAPVEVNGTGVFSSVVRAQNGYAPIENSICMVTRNVNESDQWELKIPLTFFSSDPDTIKTITFYCSNLGPQELVCTGTPTWPAVTLIIAGAIAASGAAAITIRKKRLGQNKIENGIKEKS